MSAGVRAVSTDDPIVAIATPPGRGAIGVVRLSGPDLRAISHTILTRPEPLSARLATLTHVRAVDAAGGSGTEPPVEPGVEDEVVATFFPGPHSYTGQDVLEISAHGSPVVLHGIVRACLAAGARLAEPGEFTLRAFLLGRRDLVRAEAVADLVDASTTLQARVALEQLDGGLTRRIADLDARLFDLIARLEASLDFPDEGYHFVEDGAASSALTALLAELDRLVGDGARGRVIREGATVVIAGRPNVGKSRLFNALAGFDRAIVTDVPGTTRDLVAETIDVLGLAVRLVDTAGLHESDDVVEREGMRRAEQAARGADLRLLVLDGSEPARDGDLALLKEDSAGERIVVVNKADMPQRLGALPMRDEEVVRVSATEGTGLGELRRRIVVALTGREPSDERPAVTNARHVALLERVRTHVAAGHALIEARAPEEVALVELQAARAALDEVVGRRGPDDLLAHIFSRFCIGK